MANSLSAFTPELWSRKGVAILRERLVMPQLMFKDFTMDLAQAGDTVNTRKPAKFAPAEDFNSSTGVSVQDASATNIAVTLNQHKERTFKISDREATRSFANLAAQFLEPASLALANAVDISALGLYTDVTTAITRASAGTWKTAFSQARTQLNKNLAPSVNRVAVLSDDDEGDVMNLDLLTQANTSGSVQNLREGAVGRFKGFDIFRATNVAQVGSPAVRKNLFFNTDAFALVVRPISTATGRTPGAEQSIGADQDAGLAIRTTISYNSTLLHTQVTVDILYGVKTLDADLACLVNAS